MIRTIFFHRRSASPIVASFIGKRTKPIWYAIEAFVVLHHVVCGLEGRVCVAARHCPARRQVHWCMVLSSPTATMWSILDPNHLTWYVSCWRALYNTRGRSLLVRLSQWGQSFYIFLKRKQSFKVHIHLLELAQFEFLRQILLITLCVLITVPAPPLAAQ